MPMRADSMKTTRSFSHGSREITGSFAFDSRRTPCPRCGARRGMARVMSHPDAGKCHACGAFIPPERYPRARDRRQIGRPLQPLGPARSDRQIVDITKWELATVDEYTDEQGT